MQQFYLAGPRRVLGMVAALSVVGVLIFAAIMSRGGTPRVTDDPIAPLIGSVDYWTSLGSTGSVDERDFGIVKLTGPKIGILNGVSYPATLNVRYNITPTPNFEAGNTLPFIFMRYIDNGPDAQIVAKLKSYDITSGAITTLFSFDSDDFAQSSAFQTQVQFAADFTFNFNTNGYWLEVTIQRNSSAGKVSIGLVKVGEI